MSKVPVEICLFLWRRLRASGRATSQGISRRANRAAGPGYGADEAPVSGNAGCVRGRSAGHSRWHPDAGEGARLSTGDAGRCRQRRFLAEPAGFSRGGTDVSAADASGGAAGGRRSEGGRGAFRIFFPGYYSLEVGVAVLTVGFWVGGSFSTEVARA